MAAPAHNQNAMTNGTRRSIDAARAGHRARRLPPGFRYVANEASKYASTLHADVEAAHGSVDREQLEIIEAAAAFHQHALYVLRVLRVDHASLKPETRVAFSVEIAKASQRRADLVKLLKLSEPQHSLDLLGPLLSAANIPAHAISHSGHSSPPTLAGDSIAVRPAARSTDAAAATTAAGEPSANDSTAVRPSHAAANVGSADADSIPRRSAAAVIDSIGGPSATAGMEGQQ